MTQATGNDIAIAFYGRCAVLRQKVEALVPATWKKSKASYIRANHPAMLAVWAYTSSQLHGQSAADVTMHNMLELGKMSERFDILVKDSRRFSQRDGGFTAAVISAICGQSHSPPARKVCRWNGRCTKAYCTFSHPEKKSCRYGAGCPRRGSCLFAHPGQE
jgi:hypothetical protein